MRFILIRHGQTEWNLKGRIQGWLDSKLTKDAVVGLKTTDLPKLYNPILFSSDLGRANQSGEIIANRIGTHVISDSRLRERRLGELEGKIADKDHHLHAHWRAYQNRYTKQIGNAFGIESEQDFEKRIRSFMASVNEQSSESDIVIVSHGEWIRAFINILEGIPSWHSGSGIPDNGRAILLSA